jgi:hypothetical protein
LNHESRQEGTALAYKPEHAVDLDTGAIVAAPIHAADQGDVATLPATLKAAAENLAEINLAPTRESPCALIADKRYNSRDRLKDLADSVWKTRISEPKPAKGYLRWHGDEAARDAVYANRARLKSGVGRAAMRRRGELVERSFAHALDRGGIWFAGLNPDAPDMVRRSGLDEKIGRDRMVFNTRMAIERFKATTLHTAENLQPNP